MFLFLFEDMVSHRHGKLLNYANKGLEFKFLVKIYKAGDSKDYFMIERFGNFYILGQLLLRFLTGWAVS